MKRVILYILILTALLFAPLERVEIANLEPVQGVWMYVEDEKIVLETDTEDKGVGATAEEALMNMKQKSAGIIYLDTAQYLLVTNAEHQIPVLQQYLKGTVQLCSWSGEGDLTEAVMYADAHNIGWKLQDWTPNVKLPNLPV